MDFWCATASQIGFFEELKQFVVRSDAYSLERGTKAPRPDPAYLGVWWNVWDANDVLSYTAAPIFEGVDDEEYDGGLSLIGAHGGYLARPSFFRALGRKLEEAGAAGWGRP